MKLGRCTGSTRLSNSTLNYKFYISAFLLSSDMSLLGVHNKGSLLKCPAIFRVPPSCTILLLCTPTCIWKNQSYTWITDWWLVYYLVTLVEAGHAGKAYLALLLSIDAWDHLFAFPTSKMCLTWAITDVQKWCALT